ncbi:MAG: hypothetical protein HQK77_18435 [Desulfobacterales bacterium]|nr:hypothetical protein [Desulfobacterales bacterium]
MSKKLTPNELRLKAKQLLEQANKEQELVYIKIGKFVESYLTSHGDNNTFNLEEFKSKVNAIINPLISG